MWTKSNRPTSVIIVSIFTYMFISHFCQYRVCFPQLMCLVIIIGLFDQPVTFRKLDSIIFFDTFWTRDSWELNTWDISFRFKTTAENGVMVYRTGADDFIEVKLVSE